MKHARTSKTFPVDPAAIQAAIDAAPERAHDPECPYDPNDEKSVKEFWLGGKVRKPGERGPGKKPPKVSVSIRLDPDIVEFFRSQGEGWQSRINAVLREAVAKR